MRRIAIVGATAVGKTALAVELARRVGDLELISVDAMAVYRGLDIGTAKPTAAERRAVRWHLVDCVAPAEEFSVVHFQQLVRAALGEADSREAGALLVGGTGLYHRAVVDDIELPPHFPDVRNALEHEAAKGTDAVVAMHARLIAADPEAAAKMQPNNARRVVRALEVVVGSGRPFSSFGPGLRAYAPTRWTILGLTTDRDRLDQAIAERLDRQLSAGFVDEVAGLLARPGGLSRTARQALGYRELIEHLGGARDLRSTREEILRRTRSFARRQESWFRRDPRVVWLDANAPDVADQALERAVRTDRARRSGRIDG